MVIVIPTPGKNEDEKTFISRCIPVVMDEGTAKDEKQGAAICYSIWREKHQSDCDCGDRVLLHLNASDFRFDFDNTSVSATLTKEELSKPVSSIKRSTILVGDGIYRGIKFPADEIEKAFMSFDKQPVNLDHSDRVEDEVGYIIEPMYDSATKRLTVQPVIAGYGKSQTALDYINNRLSRGVIPEVSIGVWVTKKLEEQKDGSEVLVAREIKGDHLALVTRGACSPQDGCGIGLTQDCVDTDKVRLEKLKERIRYLGGKKL